MSHRRKITLYIVLAVLVLLLAGTVLLWMTSSSPQSTTRSSGGGGGSDSGGTSAPVVVTESNLKNYLQTQSIITELPKNGVIALEVGNGIKYTLTKGAVSEGFTQEADLYIWVPGDYLDDLSNGLCYTVQKAKANNDLHVTFQMSETTLLWKYKSMLEYRDCLGL